MINFGFFIGKQPYREAISFVSYIHVVNSYNDINYTYLHAYKLSSTLGNVIDIQWSRPVEGGGQLVKGKIVT